MCETLIGGCATLLMCRHLNDTCIGSEALLTIWICSRNLETYIHQARGFNQFAKTTSHLQNQVFLTKVCRCGVAVNFRAEASEWVGFGRFHWL